jgi:RHS repeat-associated protein
MRIYRELAWRCVVAGGLLALFGSCGPGDTTASGQGEPATDPKDAGQDPIEDVASGDPEGVRSMGVWKPRPASAEALAQLAILRERFTDPPVRSAPAAFENDEFEDADSGTADGGPEKDVVASSASSGALERGGSSVLLPGLADHFEESARGLRPRFPGGIAEQARVLLPAQATAPTRLEDAASGMAVEFTLKDARTSPGEVAEGYLVYRDGHASGATLLRRALRNGAEDFLSFEERPATAAVSYELILSRGVRGLRLIGGMLEMLDAKGAPRLRVTPPYVIGSDHVRTDAALAVEGCAVDRNPAPPWDRPVTDPGAATCTVRVAWKDEGVVYPALLDPAWTETSTMAWIRRSHTATLLPNGQVLVAGGTIDGANAIKKVELYNPSLKAWAIASDMDVARMRHTASQLGTTSRPATSGSVLFVGGRDGSSSLHTTRHYWPSTGTWTPGVDLGTPRDSHSATVLADGRVLIAGGVGNTTVFPAAALFDPEADPLVEDPWNSTPNMPSNSGVNGRRRWHTATLLSTANASLNNRVLVVGGNNGGTNSVAIVLAFNPANTSWSVLPPLPGPREGHTATLLSNGKVLVTGGRNGTTPLNTALLFDPGTTGNGSWAAAGTLNPARELHTATLLSSSIANSGSVLLAGGSNTSGSLGTSDLFNGVNTWTATAPLFAAVNSHTATLLGTGSVLLAGGISGNAVTSQLYDPSLGASCSSASQCLSGHCVNGICCDSACSGECAACNLPGEVGNCKPKPPTTPCSDDGNVCSIDACDGASLDCQHVAGNGGMTCRGSTGPCDPAETCTGATSVCPADVFSPDQTSCADGDLCDGTERCNASGQCMDGQPVTCAPSDQCHSAGICNPATGVCSDPPLNGTSCQDGNPCTQGDVCIAGVCSGTPIAGCPTNNTGGPIVLQLPGDFGFGITALAVAPGAARAYLGGVGFDRDSEHLAVVSLDTNGGVVGAPLFYKQAASSVLYTPDSQNYVTDIVVDFDLQRLYLGWAHHWSTPLNNSFLTVYTLDNAGNVTGEPRSYACTTTSAGVCTQGIHSLALDRTKRVLYAGATTAAGGAIIAYNLDASGEPTVHLGDVSSADLGYIMQLAVRPSGDKLYAGASGTGLTVFELNAQGVIGTRVFTQTQNFPTTPSNLFNRLVYSANAIYRRPSGVQEYVGVPDPLPLTYWPLDSQGIPVSTGWIATEHPAAVDVAFANGALTAAQTLQVTDALSGVPATVGASINAFAADTVGRPSATASTTQSLVGQKPVMAAASLDERTVVITRRIWTNTNLTSNFHLRVSILSVDENTCPSAFTLRTIDGGVATQPFTWNASTAKCESAWLAVDSVFAASSPLANRSERVLFDVTVNAPFPAETNFQIEAAQGSPTAGGTVLATISDSVSSVTAQNRMFFYVPGYSYPGDRAAAVETLTQQAATQAGWAAAVSVPPSQRPAQFTISAFSMFGQQGSTSYLASMSDTLARLGINSVGIANYWPELGQGVAASALSQRGIANGLPVNPWGPQTFLPTNFDFQCDAACLATWANGVAQTMQELGIPAVGIREFPLQWGPAWQFRDAIQLVTNNPTYLAIYRQYMASHGFPSSVTPIGRASALDNAPLVQRQQFYWTTKFFEQSWANLQKAASQAIQSRFPNAFVHSTPRPEHFPSVVVAQTYQQFDGLWPADQPYTADGANQRPDWFLAGRQSAVGVSTANWVGDIDAQVASYNAEVARSASAFGDRPFGAYIGAKYTGEHSEGFSYKALSFIGRGAKILDLYSFGPRVFSPTGDAWADKKEAYGPIARTMRRIGAAESALYPGKPERSKVAVQLLSAERLWDPIPDPFPTCNGACLGPRTTLSQYEARGLHAALTHQGYAVDFVDDTDLATPNLLTTRGYEVVYLTQLNISTAAQQEIGDWVAAGGTVVASAGAGLWDEYNTRSTGGTNTLLGVLGLNAPPASGSWTHLRDPLHLSPAFNYSNFVNSAGRNAAGVDLYANFEQVGTAYDVPTGLVRLFAASLSPGNETTTIANFTGPGAQGPAVTTHPHGSGTAVAYGFFPGMEYLISQERKSPSRLASGWDPLARRRAAAPVVHVQPARNVYTSVPGVEALRLNSAGPTIAVVLLNWTDQPLSSVTVTIAGAANLTVTSVEGASISTAIQGADLQVTLPVNAVDILTLRCANPAVCGDGSMPPRQRCFSDFSGDGIPDIVGNSSADGVLKRAEGNGQGGLKSVALMPVAEGWEGFDTIISPGDFDSDGAPDLLARRASDGALLFYKGTGSGTLAVGNGIGIATGWGAYIDLMSPGDFDSDGYPDVLVRTQDGHSLVLFRGNGSGGFINPSGTPFDHEWEMYTDVMSPGDFGAGNSTTSPGVEDGIPDIIGRKSDGTLWLYRGIGNGTLAQNPGYQIEEGWVHYSKLLRAGDFDGDGHSDVLAATPEGNLYFYKGAGNGLFVQVSPALIGTGFDQFSSLCVPAEVPSPNGSQCSDGNPCTAPDTCNGAGICVPGALSPGCLPHCANAIRDADETGLDCGGSCPACPAGTGGTGSGGSAGSGGGAGAGGGTGTGGASGASGGAGASGAGGTGGAGGAGGSGGGTGITICSTTADCPSGLICGENNGACFGSMPRATRVCWDPQCVSGGHRQSCGDANSLCGSNCDCVNPCDPTSPSCPTSEVCKPRMGGLFYASVPDICVDPRCPSNDPTLCGFGEALCGQICVCTPDCSSATCANPADGCGGVCPGTCPGSSTGCTEDVNCPADHTCLASGDGTRTCRPSICFGKALVPPLCGSPGAPCGDQCPACQPQCDGRQCGADLSCGQSCGTCDEGKYCNAAGQCITPRVLTPVTIPDGTGGSTTVDVPPAPPPSRVGSLAGAFSISERGTSEYTVPIDVPPGRAGIQPSLALKYAASKSNGDIGMGWRLDGLSLITRCPRIHALDSRSGPVRGYSTSSTPIETNGDYFCLDGQRLVAVPGVNGGGTGAYGANGTEYRTLLDSFARIVSKQDDGAGIQLNPYPGVPVLVREAQGPDSFQVWTKDGKILTFGGTIDSIVMELDGPRYSWLLSKVEDRAGNTMTVTYKTYRTLLAGSNNNVRPLYEIQPSVISYTGHGSDVGNRQVRFVYEGQYRPDPSFKFLQGGIPVISVQRMSRILTYVDNKPVKNYRLVYEESGATQTSQIAKIFECTKDGDTHCKAPTQFEYYNDAGYTLCNLDDPLSCSGPGISESASQFDMNGDGIPDYLMMKTVEHPAETSPWVTAAMIAADIALLIATKGASAAVQAGTQITWAQSKPIIRGLLAGDPEVEIRSTMHVGTGNRLHPVQGLTNVSGIPCLGARTPVWMLDYDRDGRDDVLVGCRNLGTFNLSVGRSIGNGTFTDLGVAASMPSRACLNPDCFCLRPGPGCEGTGSIESALELPRPILLDLNGDSLEDLLYCQDRQRLMLRLRTSPNQGFDPNPIEIVGTSFCDGRQSPTYAVFDIDGDGSADLLSHGLAGGWGVLRFTPPAHAGWEIVDLKDVGSIGTGDGASFGDFNNDGLTDLYRADGDKATIWLSGGRNRFYSRLINRPQPALGQPAPPGPFTFQKQALLDHNADGYIDLVESWKAINGGQTTFFNVALLSNGLGTAVSPTDAQLLWPRGGPSNPGLLVPGGFRMVGDVDGDGSPDLFGNKMPFYGKGQRNRLLKRVVDGAGRFTAIQYDANSPSATYTNTGAGSCGTTWPDTCLKRMSGLVSSYDEGYVTNVGDTLERSHQYQYVNAHVSVTGEGWLGFERKIARSFAAGRLVQEITTAYEAPQPHTQAGQKIPNNVPLVPPYIYPLAGLPRTIIVDSYPLVPQIGDGSGSIENGSFIRRSVQSNIWAVKMSASNRPFPFLDARVTKTYDKPLPATPLPFEDNGTTLTFCTETRAPDGYGNVVTAHEVCQGTPSTPEEETTSVNEVTPNPVTWLISTSTPQYLTTTSKRGGETATQLRMLAYYPNGLLHYETRAPDSIAARRTAYVRDSFGNPTLVTEEAAGEANRSTTISYDAEGIYPERITNGKGQETEVRFDPRWGKVTISADANKIFSTRTYDDFGRLVMTTGPIGTSIATYSDALNAPEGLVQHVQVVAERQGIEGSRTGASIREFDHEGRIFKTTSEGLAGVQIFQDWRYDDLGRLLSRSLPHTSSNPDSAPKDRFAYDRLHNVRRIDHADGTHREYQYASTATLDSQYYNWLGVIPCSTNPPDCPAAVDFVHSVDETGRRNVTIRNHRGLIVRTIDGDNVLAPEPMASSYEYGPFNRLRRAYDNRGSISEFIYDDYGRQTSFVDPDTGPSSSTYNGFDELKTARSPNNHVRTYHYDVLGRLTQVEDPGVGMTQWIYDTGPNALGRLSESISPPTAENAGGNHVKYFYEPTTATARHGLLKQVETTLDGTAYASVFGYDDVGRLRRVDYPNLGAGAPIAAAYLYDPSGVMYGVNEVGSTPPTPARPLWRLDGVFEGYLVQDETFGNDASTHYQYDPDRRWLDNLQTTTSAGVVQSLEYEHFANGQVEIRTTALGKREYTYDNLNRLGMAIDTPNGGSSQTSNYRYDASGNITTRGNTTLSYRSNQPHLLFHAGGNSYIYDANGNVTSRSGSNIPGGEQTFEYTPFDLPRIIYTGTGPGMKPTRFEYSANEARVIRRDAETTRYFVGNNYQRVVTTGTNATVEERFTLLLGTRVLGEIVRKNGSDETLYFHSDHQGSVDTTTSGSNVVTQEYDPFGSPIDPPNPPVSRAGFTGHQHDDDLGLIDMKGRIYDPIAARFTSADPVMQAPYSTQGLNRYSYVFNDPVNNVDPSGFEVDWSDGRAQLTIGLLGWATGIGIGTGLSAIIQTSGAKGIGTAAAFDVLGRITGWVTTGPNQTAVRQGLIEFVVRKYDIDTTNVNNGFRTGQENLKEGPRYQQTMTDQTRGVTYLDTGEAFIGPEAFSSEQGLAATIKHEAEVHARDQRLNGRVYENKVGQGLVEVEANYKVLLDAKRLNLPEFEIERIQQGYNRFYDQVLYFANKMSPEAAQIYKRRMDQHIFTLAHVY